MSGNGIQVFHSRASKHWEVGALSPGGLSRGTQGLARFCASSVTVETNHSARAQRPGSKGHGPERSGTLCQEPPEIRVGGGGGRGPKPACPTTHSGRKQSGAGWETSRGRVGEPRRWRGEERKRKGKRYGSAGDRNETTRQSCE